MKTFSVPRAAFALLGALALTVLLSFGLFAASKGEAPMAVFDTSMGKFTVKLFPDIAPKTVDNFVGLATGKKEYIDPETGKTTTGRFYDGLVFHRVIDGFMIQGGDPLGNGRGGPGYRFEDEFENHYGFRKKGLLAMANAGPNTNGSQFFVTVAPTPHLEPKRDPYGRVSGHTVFGEVVEGYEVVEAISQVPNSGPPNNRPLEPVTIKKVTIIEK